MKAIPFKFIGSGWTVSQASSALLAVVAASALGLAAQPAQGRDLTPDISSRVWVEGDRELAAVSMNGKDLITFRSKSDSDDAAEEAEDLAVHLQELLADKKFDVNQLLPGKDGDRAVIKLGGDTVVSFMPLNGKESDEEDSSEYLDAGLKLVNGLRAAFGASVLPSTFPDLFDKSSLAGADGKGQLFSGQASWYGPKFHGRKTSDGHRFDMDKLTAAHRSLPFGTKLLVTNRKTGSSCVVEVNDRGPFIDGRVIDLSRGAARQLNMLGSGVAMVDCLVLSGN